MLLSIAFMVLLGLLLSNVFERLKLPRLLGMLLSGILLGPYVFDMISSDVFLVSLEIRYMALVVILLRAGLSLRLEELKETKIVILLLSFVPALIEILGALILGPILFGFSVIESLLLGSIIAAVSPAVIVPKMIDMINKGQGQKRKIPQMILASASLDDIVVIVLFTSFLSLELGQSVNAIDLIELPVSIVMGIVSGIIIGFLVSKIFQMFHMRDTIKVMVLIAVGLFMIGFENVFNAPYSGLIGVMSLAMMVLYKIPHVSKRLVFKFEKVWVVAELLLFILIGAAFDLSNVTDNLWMGIILILGMLVFRMIGVFMALIPSKFTFKEKLFVSISFIPKATVQASIAGIPLSLGVISGNTMLSIGVLAIIVTAPLGATLIDMFKHKLI